MSGYALPVNYPTRIKPISLLPRKVSNDGPILSTTTVPTLICASIRGHEGGIIPEFIKKFLRGNMIPCYGTPKYHIHIPLPTVPRHRLWSDNHMLRLSEAQIKMHQNDEKSSAAVQDSTNASSFSSDNRPQAINQSARGLLIWS